MNKQHHLHKYASFIIFSRLLLLHYCLRLLRINRTVPIIFQNKANVIAALNGPMAHIYLRNGNVWDTTLPDATELRKLAQHIKLYLKDGGAKIKSEKVKAQFKNLLSSVDIILIRENGAYKIFNGLNVANSEIADGAEYIKAIKRIDGLNDPNRSGDIILIMNDKTNDAVSNRYTTGVACKSWHGSLNPSDSYVPLIVAYPGGNKKVLEQIIDETDGCKVATGCDGNWRVTDLIKKIIEKQYPVK